ncbi:MAG: hypothetical protein IJZ29_01350 [Clostridia bacterium]|nr:hypothetical protein [Clostridia bacterium]
MFNYDEVDECKKYQELVKGNILAFKKRAKSLNNNSVLLISDITNIKVDVIKDLLSTIYKCEDATLIAKCCNLLCVCDDGFNQYFKFKGEKRKNVITYILAKYVYSNENLNDRQPYSNLNLIYKSMLETIVPTNSDLEKYAKVVAEDKAKQQIQSMCERLQ